MALGVRMSSPRNAAVWGAHRSAFVEAVVAVAVADDDSSGVGRLVFTRPISRTTYTAGKTVAIGTLLAIGIGLAVYLLAQP